MTDANMQPSPSDQLKIIARRFMADLGHIYRTPEQGRMLQCYIQHHIFTRMEIASLPLPAESHDLLSDIAGSLTDSFFEEGKEKELGWKPWSMQVVAQDLHDIIVQLLRLKAERDEWEDGMMVELKRAASENAPVGRGGRLPRPSRLRRVDGGVPESTEACDKRTSQSIAERATVVSEAVRGDATQANGSSGELSGIRPQARTMAAGTNRDPSSIGLANGGEDDGIQEAELASILTAIQEMEQREEEQKVKDAQWAENVESRLAREKTEKAQAKEYALTEADMGAEDDADFEEDELYESSVCGGNEPAGMSSGPMDIITRNALSDSGDQGDRRTAAVARGGKWSIFRLDDGEYGDDGIDGQKSDGDHEIPGNDFDGDWQTDGNDEGYTCQAGRMAQVDGSTQNGAPSSYECMVCKDAGIAISFFDADVLNEHYQKHIGEV